MTEGSVLSSPSSAPVADLAGATDLASLIRSRPPSIAEFLTIAIQLADAIARMHAVRIVHRDTHPGNVVWNSQGGRNAL